MSKRRVWLDSNVVLDLILERDPFVEDSEQLFTLQEAGQIEIYISSLTLANIAYVVKKNGRNPVLVTSKLMMWTNVVSLERHHFEKNIVSDFRDFEDGLQYFSAIDVDNLELIITRNKSDFKASLIPVLTPTDFLQTLSKS